SPRPRDPPRARDAVRGQGIAPRPRPRAPRAARPRGPREPGGGRSAGLARGASRQGGAGPRAHRGRARGRPAPPAPPRVRDRGRAVAVLRGRPARGPPVSAEGSPEELWAPAALAHARSPRRGPHDRAADANPARGP